MTYTERKQKQNYLLELIQNGRLFSLETVAVNFNCSKRTVERMLNDLRKEGYHIKYCRVQQKYFL